MPSWSDNALKAAGCRLWLHCGPVITSGWRALDSAAKIWSNWVADSPVVWGRGRGGRGSGAVVADSISNGKARCVGPGVPPSAVSIAVASAGIRSCGRRGRAENLVIGDVTLIWSSS